MAETGVKKEHAEVSYDDDEVALVGAAAEPAVDDDDPAEEGDLASGSGGKSEAQMNGVMVLSLLDKIIGVVDKIQHTQNGLEARQEAMEKSVSTIQGELAKLSKNHIDTSNTVNKMLDKVRKVSVNVKSVRSNLEKQAGQIKKLESNESELLKRRNFKVLIYQDQVKTPKQSKSKIAETAEGKATDGLEQIAEEGQEDVRENPNSDEEVVVDEIIVESRTKRFQHATKQQVDNIKKAFSKEKMEKTKIKTKENLEKTKQRTRENLEKTRQRTRDNLEKTKHSLEKKMGKLGTRMTPNMERRAKIKSSKEKMKKSLTPDHTVYARSKTTVYRVPPFTFHVKKIREGEEEVLQNTEMVEVTEAEAQPGEEDAGLDVEVEEDELVNVDGPEMQALLEVTDDSQLVMVESDLLKKAQHE
ncbi:caveolae-associated protein 1 [Nothobranchius furzeri]|uniref:Polymerase I and transcript release factor n=1 Tax=Nothobranchius furzeri TaxID=105023 RepID=A0A1A7ZZL3_NOTFU|nr:caveolae-associated protein 1 [Nothobranchius furzeri]KAF7225729.1 polymerase I and transcript release factor [Nothobranchius furzeri]